MLEAHIVGPRGSLYFAAPATPYDLETLKTHVRDAESLSPRQVHVELTLDRAGTDMDRELSRILWELAKQGVEVSVV